MPPSSPTYRVKRFRSAISQVHPLDATLALLLIVSACLLYQTKSEQPDSYYQLLCIVVCFCWAFAAFRFYGHRRFSRRTSP